MQKGNLALHRSFARSKEEAEQKVSDMVKAFGKRFDLEEIKLASAEHIVEKIGSAFAAVPLWY